MRPSDISRELADLARQAHDLARRSVPNQPANARYDGYDATGLVRVTVDATGVVHDVQVNGGWRHRVATGQLGEAICQAVDAAISVRLAAWQAATEEALSRPVGRSTTGLPLDRDGGMTALAGDAALAEPAVSRLLSLASQVNAGIDELAEKAAALVARTSTGYSTRRQVAVTINGANEILAVDIDQRWLAHAHAASVGAETSSAFHAAYQAAGPHRFEDLIAASPIGELRTLVKDRFGLDLAVDSKGERRWQR